MRMRLGIMKLGANITWAKSNVTAANIDIVTTCRALSYHFDLSVVTHKTRNTKIPKAGKLIEIMDCDINECDLDALVVFNGNVNFFGGGESPEGIMNYVHINKFKGPVYYVLTDGQLPFKQIWPAVKDKPWAKNWEENEVTIDREIICLSQGKDIAKTHLIHAKQKGFIPATYRHFPFEQAILLSSTIKEFNETPTFDLAFGGRVRSTGRRKDILEFYVKHTKGLKVNLFGSLNPKVLGIPPTSDTSHVSFSGKVSNAAFINKMRQAKATCIIGDPLYHNNFHTLRMYESVLARTVTFLDERMFNALPDVVSGKMFYTDPYIRDFLVVKSGKQLADRVKTLDLATCMNITNIQLADIQDRFYDIEYHTYLANLIIPDIKQFKEDNDFTQNSVHLNLDEIQ